MSVTVFDSVTTFITYLSSPDFLASSLTVIAGVLSTAAGVLTYFLQVRLTSKYKASKEKLSLELKQRLAIESSSLRFEKASSEDLAKKIYIEVQDEIIRYATEQQGLTKQFVTLEVEEKMGDLTQRLQTLENRLPSDTLIDKITSINEALLALRTEQLSERIIKLENNQLTKWDVAITLSVLLGGILTIVGTTYSVLKAFSIIS